MTQSIDSARGPAWPRRAAPAFSGIAWPMLPDNDALRLYTLADELARSERREASLIEQNQFVQLRPLLAFARATIPFYRRRLDGAGYVAGMPITPEFWARIPLLRRADVQRHNAELCSSSMPADHGPMHETQTSGSTGQPVRVKGTAITRLMWYALTLRHYAWHIDNLQGKLGVIRALATSGPGSGQQGQTWGRPFNRLYQTGPSASADCRQDVATLLEWLDREQPEHLLVFPSTLEAMALRIRAQSRTAPRLKTVITTSETLAAPVRALAQEVFDCRIADMYTAQEVGYIALQCPETDNYHVQSESLLVEILDDDGQPCAPGQPGRVAVTTLHNFASPLLRYLIGDYAVMGPPCACGRGLPTLERVLGRTRNLIALPDGRRYWPVLYAESWSGIAPIHQIQLVQKTPERFLVRMHAERELLDSERERLVEVFRKSLGYPFEFDFEQLAERIVYANGKFDSIVSEVP